MTRALVVFEDGPLGLTMAEIRDVATNRPDEIRAILGGWLEAIAGPAGVAGPWHAYCDEEGKIKGRAINTLATVLAIRLGWEGLALGDVFLVGPVVFLGGAGPDEADVPAEVLTALGVVLDAAGVPRPDGVA